MKVRDLTGQEFGYYTALFRLSKEEKEKRKLCNSRTYWMCRCRCGVEKPVEGVSLTRLTANSCGCARQRNVKPGAVYGKLKVVRMLTQEERINAGKDPKQPYWLCVCDCGGTSIQQTANLMSGKGHHCGCENSLAGQTFGRLTVLSDTGKRLNESRVYLCQCTCGNQKEVKSHNLVQGFTQSCGCLYDERRNDLSGKRFGRLTALRIATETEIRASGRKEGQPRTFWLCRCTCGKEVAVQDNALTTGGATSCGCYKKEKMRGKTHPCYNHRLTKEERKKRCREIYYAEEQNAWRKSCFERENYTCQVSGIRGSIPLSVHHVENYADNQEKRWSVKNGYVLDSRLHTLFHTLYGNRGNNRQQLTAFAKRVRGLNKKQFNRLLSCFELTEHKRFAYKNKETAVQIVKTVPNGKNLTYAIRK